MKLKRKILGNNWTIRVVTEKEMARQREDGAGLAGLCVPSERTIYIQADSVDYQTILHELYHSYFSYLHLDDTNTIPLEDMEEIVCSHFVSHGENIINKAKKITKDLKKMMEEG